MILLLFNVSTVLATLLTQRIIIIQHTIMIIGGILQGLCNGVPLLNIVAKVCRNASLESPTWKAGTGRKIAANQRTRDTFGGLIHAV